MVDDIKVLAERTSMGQSLNTIETTIDNYVSQLQNQFTTYSNNITIMENKNGITYTDEDVQAAKLAWNTKLTNLKTLIDNYNNY